MRILVTGAAGMLGHSLVPVLRVAQHEVTATDIVGVEHAHLDVRHRDHVRAVVQQQNPDLVVHLAALTNLEQCDASPDDAYRTNVLGTIYVAEACYEATVPMAYVSTAGVFNGQSAERYTEFDEPDPINTYGTTKWLGEEAVRAIGQEHFIVRAGWMMSGGRGVDHKFVSLITSQVLAGAKEIRAVGDKFGSPTSGEDFSRTFCEVITGRYGTFHVTSGEKASRYEVAAEIVQILVDQHVDLAGILVTSTSSEEFRRQGFTSARPDNEALRNYVLELEGRNTMRPWREALRDYMHGSPWRSAFQ